MEGSDPPNQWGKTEPITLEGGGSSGDFFDVIPAFTVLKKGAAIKNIFLHCPISPRSSESTTTDGSSTTTPTAGGVRFLVGRHPDCHVVLDHPSVSRFHLELLSRPASRKLTVTDLSSVHGTSICGRRLEQRLPVELREGDVLKIGASTRVYVLRWVVLRGTNGSSNPLALGSLPEEDKAEEEEEKLEGVSKPDAVADNEHRQNGWNHMFLLQSSNNLQAERTVQSPPLILESLVFSSMGRSSPSSKEEEADRDDASRKNEEKEKLEAPEDSQHRQKNECNEVLFENHNSLQAEPVIPSAPLMPECLAFTLDGSPSLSSSDNEEEDGTTELKESMEAEEASPKKDHDKIKQEEQQPFLSPQPMYNNVISGLLSRRSKSVSMLRVRTGRSREKMDRLSRILFTGEKKPGNEVAGESHPSEKENLTTVAHSSCELKIPSRGGDSYASEKENLNPVAHPSCESKNLRRELIDMSAMRYASDSNHRHADKKNCRNPEKEPENEVGEPSYPSDKENLSPATQPSQKLKKPGKELSVLSVMRYASDSNHWPVGKENCILESFSKKSDNDSDNMKSQKPLSSNRDLKENKMVSDKENSNTEVSAALKVQPRKLFSERSSITEQEIYISDKENWTPKPPNSSSKPRETRSSNRQRIESAIFKKRATERVPFQSLLDSPLTQPSSFCSSNAENSPTNDSEIRREISAGRKVERVPIQTLVDNSIRKPKNSSGDNASSQNARTSFVINCNPKSVTERKKKWTIVADVSSFTDEESRRSLQLLEGIRGTRLIIPRLVIRELDYLKRTEGLFRKTASRASENLQWIEGCMLKTSWWIHVQSSAEMAPVAPTPPVTPRSDLDDLSEGIMSCSKTTGTSVWGRRNSLAEIVSPTADDHILDCALLFGKLKVDDEQIVLLTNSVSLKIKAMAEGLLCETARAFRESLVNPFSERFLWVDSSPRGPTWSLAEEAAALVESHQQLVLPPPVATRRVAGASGKATERARGLKLILLHNSHYGQLNTVT